MHNCLQHLWHYKNTDRYILTVKFSVYVTQRHWVIGIFAAVGKTMSKVELLKAATIFDNACRSASQRDEVKTPDWLPSRMWRSWRVTIYTLVDDRTNETIHGWVGAWKHLLVACVLACSLRCVACTQEFYVYLHTRWHMNHEARSYHKLECSWQTDRQTDRWQCTSLVTTR